MTDGRRLSEVRGLMFSVFPQLRARACRNNARVPGCAVEHGARCASGSNALAGATPHLSPRPPLPKEGRKKENCGGRGKKEIDILGGQAKGCPVPGGAGRERGAGGEGRGGRHSGQKFSGQIFPPGGRERNYYCNY